MSVIGSLRLQKLAWGLKTSSRTECNKEKTLKCSFFVTKEIARGKINENKKNQLWAMYIKILCIYIKVYLKKILT